MTTNKTTLKPSKVNEFEFIKDSKLSEGEVTYSDTALISIKVNNAVKEVKFYEDYISSDKRKNPDVSYETAFKFTESNFIAVLTELGIEVDMTDLISEYEKLLSEKKERDAKVALEKRKENYKKAWFHQAAALVKNLNNGVEASVTPFDESSTEGYYLILSYKGYKVQVEPHYVSEGTWSRHSHFAGYFFNSYKLSDRMRRAKTIEKLTETFKTLVDDKIESEKRKVREENKAKKEALSTKEKLEDILGLKVEYKKERRSSGYGRHYHGYDVDSYYMNVNEQNLCVSLFKSNYEVEEEDRIRIAGIEFTFEKAKEFISFMSK